MDFHTLQTAWLTHLRHLHRRPSTLRNAEWCTTEFYQCCLKNGARTPQEVQSKHLLDYVRELRQRDRKPLTVYLRQRTVRTWFAWLTLREHLVFDPLTGFTMAHPPLIPRGAPSEAQVRRLLGAPPRTTLIGQRDRAVLEFLYGTGLRRAESGAVELEHVDLRKRLVHVNDGKGGHQRQIPIGKNLTTLLESYLAEVRPRLKPKSSSFFLTQHGNRLEGYSVQGIVSKYSRIAGLNGCSIHQLRHAYATHLLRNGCPLPMVQRLLGHADLNTTIRYTHLVVRDLAAELRRTHPRAKRRRGRHCYDTSLGIPL